MNAAYADPSEIDGTVSDRSIHPSTECWFRTSAENLLARVREYLSHIDRYGIGWVDRLDDNPGEVLHEDDAQIDVIPLP